MIPQRIPRRLARIAAVGIVVLIAALTIVRSRRSEQTAVLAPLEHGDAQGLVQQLARCRTITSGEAAALETCRRVWAENRRQFFAAGRPLQSSIDPALNAPAAPVKNQDRVLPREVEPQQGKAR